MSGEYIFPGTIVLLKFVLRLGLNRNVTGVDFFRAVLSLPTDIAFLALSFSAIILTYLQTRAPVRLDTKSSLALFAILLLVTVIVTMFAKKSDDNFVLEKPVACVCWMVPAYLLSLYSLYLMLAAI
jgi:hypothetical protein